MNSAGTAPLVAGTAVAPVYGLILAGGSSSRMRRDKAALCALEVLEAGKNWAEADVDVAEAIDFCNFYAVAMRELSQPHRTKPCQANPIPNPGGRAASALSSRPGISRSPSSQAWRPPTSSPVMPLS